jgi:hypothetical protein
VATEKKKPKSYRVRERLRKQKRQPSPFDRFLATLIVAQAQHELRTYGQLAEMASCSYHTVRRVTSMFRLHRFVKRPLPQRWHDETPNLNLFQQETVQ